MEKLDPSWFQAVSFGAFRPLVVEYAGTPEAKAYNRRIDIVIMTEKSTKRSPYETNYGLPNTKIPGSESSTRQRVIGRTTNVKIQEANLWVTRK